MSFMAWAADVYPDRTAIIHGDRRTSWSNAYERCRRLASALTQKGVGVGDTVAIMAPNIPALFEAHYERIFALETKPALGRIAWTDLTVKDAPAIRDFWAQVAGWSPDEVSMGEYADFNMRDAEGRPAAGVCHARGSNADLPPVWLSYVSVADLDVSLEAAVRLGGEVAVDPRGPVGGRMAVVRDPAGSTLALWESGAG